ncbi:hypothetical protein GCM10010266_21000 [Streptomyces griseomycini]|uniref:hypothetical protein n=1 Tax=Streptomyces griseomycini TaxID=66895 RepID=UPI0018748186|nr:hypothetical protein [Streptomyces griseomycini]GGP97524.1 hypothetical protein GCM10010266_21000 [Streptomyces griseomycini]
MTEPVKAGRTLTGLMMPGHLVTLEELPRMAAGHGEAMGLGDVAFFLADPQGTVLRQLTGRGLDAGADGAEPAVDATVAGPAFQRVDLVAEPDASSGRAGRRWWVPVTDGVERLGALRADTDHDDEATRDALRALASVVALLLLGKRAFSDFCARLVRAAPMSVAAETQRRLIPPSAFAGHRTTVAAGSEPAYAGDGGTPLVAEDEQARDAVPLVRRAGGPGARSVAGGLPVPGRTAFLRTSPAPW